MANQKTVLLLPMNRKYKTIRDYAITAVGFSAAAIGSAVVVAEIPAIMVAGAGVILAAGAMNRLNKREEDDVIG
tara:strand:+ start:247 stop:468 length:222 start_codon:yes stop_codon:yes gene_type:complete